MVKGQHA
ncbi:Protein of unknown function [Lactobacillus delbrueckii subsp. bulgaricus]|nr:Protein of unknown function [Lactobacillus delbrueckii subsp. bulgaricus]CDR74461.1 Protein of unknown function [Lactobacillus delbrueckii subsp. bulgaricus]CDR79935.1 Protein of unknown function [Lactobacillus delbrueckii subsp. lactis]CDR83237.1 Protein of unknown function [Lactobacillus delbrueckii subsp. lactis]